MPGIKRSVFFASRIANSNLSDWLEDHAVLIHDNRINVVKSRNNLPSDIENTHAVYELGNVSVLPGMVDAHAHMHCSATLNAYDLVISEDNQTLSVRAARNMRDALLSGVTTLRDLGSKNEVAFAVRRAIKAGIIPGPRLVLAGTPITTTFGHCHMFGTVANTTNEMVQAIRNQKKLGADVIKVMATGGMFTPTANPRETQYTVDTLRVAVRESERLDLQIVAHTLSAQGIKNCVEAGVHHLIHSRWLSRDPNYGLEYDPNLTARIADNGHWVDPTYGHHLLAEEALERGDPEPEPHWSLTNNPISPEEHIACTADMRRQGVRFTTGLDMGMPYANFDKSSANARVFVKLFDYSNWEAIAASTSESAEALGLAGEIGAITSGKLADMFTVAGDPAVDITALGMAVDVIQGGQPVKLAGKSLV